MLNISEMVQDRNTVTMDENSYAIYWMV